MPPARMSEIPA